jgi:hypothetical protein
VSELHFVIRRVRPEIQFECCLRTGAVDHAYEARELLRQTTCV